MKMCSNGATFEYSSDNRFEGNVILKVEISESQKISYQISFCGEYKDIKIDKIINYGIMHSDIECSSDKETETIDYIFPEVAIVCLSSKDGNKDMISVDIQYKGTVITKNINIMYLGDLDINYLMDNAVYLLLPLKIMSIKYYSEENNNSTEVLHNIAKNISDTMYIHSKEGKITESDIEIIMDNINDIINN